MKLSFRMLAAIVVVCALAAVSRTPGAHASTPAPTSGATDRDALAALYHATGGDIWLRSDNWLSDAPIGIWYGVTTDESGRVIELNLSGNLLSGTIPPELGNLTALTYLDLNGNLLSETIPSELGNLTALTYLDLNDNLLSGTIPPELGRLTSLIWLALGWNQLSGTIPPELGNLTALAYLDLWNNDLSGTIPPELGNLTNVDDLYISGNSLRGCLPAVWKYVEYNDLDQLDLPYCGAVPSILSAAAARDRDILVALYWATDGENWRDSDNWLSDAPLGTWHGVTADESGRVIALDLNDNQLGGTIPPKLSNLASLDTLYLAGNRLTGCLPAVWKYVEYNDLDQLGLPYCAAATDRDVLIALYWATDGDKWTNNDNWLSDAPIGTWYGVTTEESGRVIALEIWYNNLSGTVPPELGNLTSLTWLALWGNQLSGTIPPELGNLTSLTWLALYDNNLSGTVPPELGNLTSLTSLSLGWNQLSGTIPPELVNLTALTELNLGGNQLIGTIPPDLGNLTALTYLSLGENLSGTIPTELGNLTALTHLSLGGNLSGTIPTELGNLTALTELVLGGNQLSGTIPPELGRLTSLTWLTLWGNQLNGAIPPELGNLTALTNLNLGGNQLSGTIPPDLGNLTALTELDLWDNNLSGTVPPDLGNLTNLDDLSLSGNSLRGCLPAVWKYVVRNDLPWPDLPYCAAVPSIRSAAAARDRDALVAVYWAMDGANWSDSDNWLSEAPMGMWHGVTTDKNGRVIEIELWGNNLSGEIPSELGNLTALKSLELLNNQLSGPIPPELGDLTNLESLSFWGNQLEGTIPSELSRLNSLSSLDLGGNRLSGTIPPELGILTNLTSFALLGNQLEGAIPSELGNLTNLTELSLGGNRLIGTIPRELGQIIYLTGLGLSENRLSGTIPPELGNLTNLERLYISDNQLTGCLPAPWKNVKRNDFDELDLPFCTASQSPAISQTPTASQSPAVSQTLTTAEIFATVSPAIAFVQTESGAGSGVLIEGNYVLTNAHVVWPYHAARVVFPDGSVLDQVPLKSWDLLADVALLGPINASVQPLTLLNGEDLPIGSDVYLIGYPGEVDAHPQPAIARGILSRLRQWDPATVTYFQIDVSVAGGQSGGALVSDTGDVIGISGFTIAEGQFALAASAADLLPRIRQLLAGKDPSGLGDRRLPLEGGALRHILTWENYWDAYIVNEPAGSAIEVALSTADGAAFRIFDPFGNEVTDAETASFEFVTQSSGPHFLVFSQLPDETTTLTANRRFARFVEPDQSREIRVGQTLSGNIDFPGDVDFFLLHLEQGEAVEVTTRSTLIDPSLGMIGLGASEEDLIIDDDSGGGLFGLDARILFQAPYTGEYILIVDDFFGIATGGYVISVARPQSMDVPTSQAPMVTITTHINVRQGPGTNYPVIDTAAPGEQYIITGKNPGLGDWWQIDYKGRTAWVYAPLVTASDARNVQVVATTNP